MPHAHVYQNNGCDLSVVPPLEFDFAYSAIVFQHIPSREIIENYVREVHRLLRPGALFKFGVQGDTRIQPRPRRPGWACRFQMRRRSRWRIAAALSRATPRRGDQYFFLWFFKI